MSTLEKYKELIAIQAEQIKELDTENKRIENLAKTRFAQLEIAKEITGKLTMLIEEMQQALKGK